MTIRDRIKDFRRVRAGDLVPSPLNFRTHPAEQRAALKAVMSEIGFAGAVLVRELPDGRLELIDGHARTEDNADMEVPVLVTDLDEAEAKVILGSFDYVSTMAEIDTKKLDELLHQIKVSDPVMQEMFAEMAKGEGLYATPEVVEDVVPEPPAVPITKPGDMWRLGRHFLLCGDSTKAEDVARVMGGERAGLCFTSPPYGNQRDYTAESKAGLSDWDALMCGVFGNLPMTDDGQVLVNLGLIHRDGEWLPYWESWIEWMRAQGWRRFGWYVWDQGAGLPGDWNGRLAPSHEFVFHFNQQSFRPEKIAQCRPENVSVGKKNTAKRKAGGKVTSMRAADGEVKAVSSTERNAVKIPDSVIRISRCATIDMARRNHPATFPVQLAAFGIQCWPGIIYEPFSGSGTTIIAGEQLNRPVYAIEISPAYCDVICTRWSNLTGQTPERIPAEDVTSV